MEEGLGEGEDAGPRVEGVFQLKQSPFESALPHQKRPPRRPFAGPPHALLRSGARRRVARGRRPSTRTTCSRRGPSVAPSRGRPHSRQGQRAPSSRAPRPTPSLEMGGRQSVVAIIPESYLPFFHVKEALHHKVHFTRKPVDVLSRSLATGGPSRGDFHWLAAIRSML